MSWNFRKRVRITKGVNLNIGKKGVSASVGTRGARTTISKKGMHQTTSIPGTGLYNRKKISNKGCSILLLLPLVLISTLLFLFI